MYVRAHASPHVAVHHDSLCCAPITHSPQPTACVPNWYDSCCFADRLDKWCGLQPAMPLKQLILAQEVREASHREGHSAGKEKSVIVMERNLAVGRTRIQCVAPQELNDVCMYVASLANYRYTRTLVLTSTKVLTRQQNVIRHASGAVRGNRGSLLGCDTHFIRITQGHQGREKAKQCCR